MPRQLFRGSWIKKYDEEWKPLTVNTLKEPGNVWQAWA
jgi:hypothetical protein